MLRRRAISPCPICQSHHVDALPAPHSARSMVSDGAVRHEALLKKSCRTCGAVSHLIAPSTDRVASFYSENYALGRIAGDVERARIARQVDFIKSSVTHIPRRILEAGCGGGFLLEALGNVWPDAELLGLEAAPELAERGKAGRARIERGFLETWSNPGNQFDLVIAINVIEHAVTPSAFLAAIAQQLTQDGEALIVCPSSTVNLELLFLDHIHTLTPTALYRLAGMVGLNVVGYGPVSALGDFQFARLARGSALPPPPEPDRGTERARYMDDWRNLDAALCARIQDGPLSAFGAGEMAVLLRAYAPHLFARIARFLVDDVTGSRSLGVPIDRLSDVPPHESGPLLLATHPRSQEALAGKLTALGYRVITWHDLIPH